jgi:hypothetical protein
VDVLGKEASRALRRPEGGNLPNLRRWTMKRLVTTFLCTALAVSLGCTPNKSAPGGPQAPGSHTASSGSADNFKISAPSGTTDVKQGQTKELTISINRGRDFKQNVKLTLSTDAKGITIKPDNTEIMGTDNSTSKTFTLQAAPDAPAGEYKVTVKGTPATGTPTETSFTIKVTT